MVCGCTSLFVQVIESPTLTFASSGEKASVVLDDAPLTIDTAVALPPPCTGLVLAVGLVVAPPEEVVAPPEDVLLVIVLFVEFVIAPAVVWLVPVVFAVADPPGGTAVTDAAAPGAV